MSHPFGWPVKQAPPPASRSAGPRSAFRASRRVGHAGWALHRGLGASGYQGEAVMKNPPEESMDFVGGDGDGETESFVVLHHIHRLQVDRMSPNSVANLVNPGPSTS